MLEFPGARWFRSPLGDYLVGSPSTAMRIAIISETYTKGMGYLENCLPRFLANLGAEVHLITSPLSAYHQRTDAEGLFEHILPESASSDDDRVQVHLLKPEKRFAHVRFAGLYSTLARIRPHVVQTTVAIGWLPLEAAIAKWILGFKLFTGAHTAASTFPLARRDSTWADPEYIRCMAARFAPGRVVSLATEKCYAVTIDCADIASRFFGVQRSKVEIMHLGVDTGVFFPSSVGENPERIALRAWLGYKPSDIVCIYTGKLTAEKNAAILAQAVCALRAQGLPFTGLFIGDGPQASAIRTAPFCTLLPFRPYSDLGQFYRAADIAVWPTNESTSMLDAAACGLPLVVSDGIAYRDHVNGNGLVVRMNDLSDLVSVLSQLANQDLRHTLGSRGAAKMAALFSWNLIAQRRFHDYLSALDSEQD